MSENSVAGLTAEQRYSGKVAIESALCRRSFYWFCRLAYPVAFSEEFIDGWHLQAICNHLQGLWEGTLLDGNGEVATTLVINTPPGVGKSRLASTLLPAWLWCHSPHLGLWFSSFGQSLCFRDAVATRQLLVSDWYKERFWGGVELLEDVNTKGRYDNTAGGWRLSASIESRAGFGEHPHMLVVDDPHNPGQALSEIQRRMALDVYDNVYSTRGIVKGVKRVIIAQRLHEMDLSAHVLKKLGSSCVHLMLPMEFESERRCRTRLRCRDWAKVSAESEPPMLDGWVDPRVEEGELLWPSVMTHKKVSDLKRDLRRAHAIAGQLQQRPSAPEGDLFLKEWFTVVEKGPERGRAVRAWDKATAVTRRSDPTAGVLVVDDGTDLYICQADQFKCEMHERDRRILDKSVGDAGRWGDYTILLEQEGASSGKNESQRHAEALHAEGFRVRIIPTGNKSKENRWKPFIGLMADGRVKLVKGAWNDDFINQCLAAPNGVHDDLVDAATMAATYLGIGKDRGRVKRDLLHVTTEELSVLREEDAKRGRIPCVHCGGLGCAACGYAGSMEGVRPGKDAELWSLFNQGCAEQDGMELGVRW